jgi:hypothetical protein
MPGFLLLVAVAAVLGLRPLADGLALNPRLPKAWPSLGVTGIYWHDLVFDVEATARRITITAHESRGTDTRIVLPRGRWAAELLGGDGESLGALQPLGAEVSDGGTAFRVNWKEAARAVFAR